jgi:hypothetical protein
MKWKFTYYWDVWGNADEGFEVNDVATLGDVELDIPDSDSDKEAIGKIAKALDKWFDPEKLLKTGFKFDSACFDDMVFELDVLEKNSEGIEIEKPFGRLEKIDEDNR